MYNNVLMYHDIHQSLESIYPDFHRRNIESVPSCEKLNKGFDFYNSNNKRLIFSQQDGTLLNPEMGYEERIYKTGVIATRKNNWHDFFNAMVWHNYPQTKIAINTNHHKELQKQKDSNRSRIRDLLTLFDECGVIIIANKEHQDMIRQHCWNKLFIDNKNAWLNGEITILTFGHAMFEKYLNPYIGMTAQALLFDKNQNNMDDFVSQEIFKQQLLLSKSELSPLPLLGIPRWHPIQNHEFYANKNYFR